jgi:hypothetical protein
MQYLLTSLKEFQVLTARVKTAFILTKNKFGFIIRGTAVMGHAGSIELMYTSTAYNLSGGNTSLQVRRNTNI